MSKAKHPAVQTLEFLHKYLDECENYTSGLGSCYESDRTEGAEYTSEAVCVGCMIDRFLKTNKVPGPNATPWTSTTRGPGFGPHGSGGDGALFLTCHACGGVKPGSGAESNFIASAIGHKEGCPYVE